MNPTRRPTPTHQHPHVGALDQSLGLAGCPSCDPRQTITPHPLTPFSAGSALPQPTMTIRAADIGLHGVHGLRVSIAAVEHMLVHTFTAHRVRSECRQAHEPGAIVASRATIKVSTFTPRGTNGSLRRRRAVVTHAGNTDARSRARPGGRRRANTISNPHDATSTPTPTSAHPSTPKSGERNSRYFPSGPLRTRAPNRASRSVPTAEPRSGSPPSGSPTTPATRSSCSPRDR